MKLKAFFINLVLSTFICYLCACNDNGGQQKTVSDSIDETVTALPLQVKSPPDNPSTPQKIELGKLLFYDPILSGDKDVSCASCHHPEYGYAEGLELSIGVNGTGLGEMRRFNEPNDIPFTKRNSQSILNTAFNGIDTKGNYDPKKAPMFWDLRTQSLELQSLKPITSLEEMRGVGHEELIELDSIAGRLKANAEYRKLFEEAFGGNEAVTILNLSKAIAAFERTLIANNSPFDKYMRGDKTALNTMEQEGLAVFKQAGCAKCHNGPMFSDFKLHVLGVPDNEKLLKPDLGAGNKDAFRTPTLRNLRYTDPYMHNGKLKTLENVMELYEDVAGLKSRNPRISSDQLDPIARKSKITQRDFRLIIEFLNTLNDDNFDRTIPKRVPSGLKVGGNI
ncbi:MAG TPA: cytochrome-c peroxidase [Pedobacter sp.]